MKQQDLFPAPPQRQPRPPAPERVEESSFEGEGCEPRSLSEVPAWLRIEGLDE